MEKAFLILITPILINAYTSQEYVWQGVVRNWHLTDWPQVKQVVNKAPCHRPPGF